MALDVERGRLRAAEAAVDVHVSLVSRINYASLHNSVAILRELCIENCSESPLTNIAVEARSNPEVIVSKRWLIERIGPRERHYIDRLDLELNAGLLWDLSEAVTADVSFVVTSGEHVLAEKRVTVEILARNEWGGATAMPELLAAFVTPNDPAVERILKDASEILHKNGLPPGIDGYQSGNPQRAAQIVGAIWSAVSSLALDYSAPPASFELQGQKVRTPSHIVESGLGTCLDLTLLFAACIEQAGMNPLIIVIRGHSFVGCWLQNDQFADVVIDDPATLRNRVRLKEMLVFESTLVTQRPAASFKAALEHADKLLAESNDARFVMAIDVRRARMQRIRPVPVERPAPPVPQGEDTGIAEPPHEIPLDIPTDIPGQVTAPAAARIGETPESRLERWQRRLLDLSLRNRLLNFRPGRGSVTLRCPDPGRFEDLLADGARLAVHPLPERFRSDDEGSRDASRRHQREEEIAAYAREGLEGKEVYADLSKEELDARLIELYRKARAGLEESGANILYVAMGFLVWRQGESKQERAFRAPLVLIPVSLERTSVRSPMRLVRHDDEGRVNPTLLQMLEKDFSIKIPELASGSLEDESGLDIVGIWNAIRRAIKDMKGWEVSEEVVLSTFSFAKYLMWKDLTDRVDQLKANPVIRHLLEKAGEPYSWDGLLPEPEALDETYPPSKSFTLLPADSHQLAAIMAVMEGRDLVIEGPPGTGKSQTITNIIAQCLAAGRSVLFVSEKRAALEVVYRRLKDIGLGDFCLELHSNKARKADVLDQLKRAWEAQGSMNQDDWLREANRLAQLRDALNRLVKELHTEHSNGLTPFRAMGMVVRDEHVPRVRLTWSSPDVHDRQALDELRDLATEMDVVFRELGEIATHPLKGIEVSEWSESWRSQFLDAISDTLEALDVLEKKLSLFLEALHTTGPVQLTKDNISLLAELADVLTHAHNREYGFSVDPDADGVLRALDEVISILNERQMEAKFLSAEYSRTALSALDIDGLVSKWKRSQQVVWPMRFLARRTICRSLMRAVSGNAKPNIDNDLPRLQKIQLLEQALAHHDGIMRRLGHAWTGVDSDVTHLRQVRDDGARLRKAVFRLYPYERVHDALQQLRYLLVDGNHLLAPDGDVGQAARALVAAYRAFSESLNHLCGQAGTTVDKLCAPKSPEWHRAVRQVLEGWRAHSGQLRTWCLWRKRREEAITKGLKPLVDAMERGVIAPGGCRTTFEVNYCRWWSSAVIDRSETLKTFIAAQHEHRIAEFRRLDDQFAALTRDYIRAKICSGIPRKGNGALNPEWNVLSRELQKKKRHLPIRQLVSKLPNALTKLTPCLLMSPLSIAQYLPPGQALFDVVIFDEASQIPVWDAIGAIARGRQTVIVGDPKQLPPTSFFERAEEDDQFAEDVEDDLESILDECLAAKLPVRRLNWHYRSKHESLIAFSNHSYYGDQLVTFPSPVTDDRAVSFRFVPDGLYEAGEARVNKPEARALVAEIVSRLRDPEFQKNQLSIGIVTFNSQQQKLIEDLLDEERRKDPSLEPWFSEETPEPLMVKNLENVQGDERDIIYFSITYGPDKAGRISMNFGPLNRDGGERRLNVAITRARQEMRVFSSLRAEQIDLTRTGAQGVRDLKRFLEYAEYGARAFMAAQPSNGEMESPFEEAVAKALRERGWQVHPQVGVSRFRIDLGVVDPDAPGRYLAGIECDGATYHRSANARDRDKLREAILRKLGWELVRVWSTDWWSDPRGALERLDQRLRALLEEARKARSADGRAVSAPAAEVNRDSHLVPRTMTGSDVEVTAQIELDEPADSLSVPAHHAGETLGSYAFAPYRQAEVHLLAVDSTRFYDDDYTPVLRELVTAIVQQEGPIRDELLVRRIARLHGFQKIGSRIRDRILSLTTRRFAKTREDVGVFLWPDKSAITSLRVFRKLEPDDERTFDDISVEELKVLARLVSSMGYTDEEAVRQMASYCGVARITANVRTRLERALSSIR